ncbi:MAG: caspase family protein [Verrucomicrobia bacterium]|nr:caspase family protein [Verrucomicrobiota bacterium]
MKKLIICLLLLQSYIVAADFHAVVVADTSSNDVRPSATIDIQKMKVALKRIAKCAKRKLKLTVLQNNDTTRDKLQNWFNNAHVGEWDVLFFYFTGHGFALPAQDTRWPNLFFKPQQEIVSMESIKDALISKNARLTIVLSDSCNKYNMAQHMARQIVRHQGLKIDISFPASRRGLEKLFRKKKGLILASGATKGNPSFASDYGGFFTQAFLLSLQEESHASHPSWNRVFEKASKLLKNAQTPQHEVNVKSG